MSNVITIRKPTMGSDAYESPELTEHTDEEVAAFFAALKNPETSRLSQATSSTSNAPSVTGHVTYDVKVSCPHCNKQIFLNQFPYNDDTTEFCLAEDDLGMALFGMNQEPAKWEDISIEYNCMNCNNSFRVTSLEI